MATLLLLCALAFLPSAAMAAPKSAKAPAQPGKTIVKFDGDQIDGDLMRPDGDLVSVRPELDMPSLVAPPASFDRAARKTLLQAADAVTEHRAH